jgi:beta-lactamase class C
MRFATVALISALIAAPAARPQAATDGEVERLVTRELAPIVPADGAGGVAVALRIAGRTLFFNYGFADLVAKRPITSDSLFNLASLRKLFEVTLLARAVERGELKLDDPVAKYVVELQQGGYIRAVALGQLATHTSGLLLPSDYPPWPERRYSLAEFFGMVNAWTPDKGQQPGKQHVYTHTAFILLQLVLERRYGTPVGELIDRHLLKPLGMTSTVFGTRGADGRGELPGALLRRAPCRAIPRGASRWARWATRRATTTSRAPGRCSPRRATWPRCSPPISASCRSTARCTRRCS